MRGGVWRRRVGALVAAGVVGVLVSGCVAASDPGRPADEKTAPAPSDSLPVGECPSGRNPGNLDYANYVVFGGRMYFSASLDATVDEGRLGADLARVRCSISENNSNVWFVPRDLDAAFLPVGTPLRAISGERVEERIAGRWEDGRWLVFSVERVGPPSATTSAAGTS